MYIDDEFVGNIKNLLDACETGIRRELVLGKLLEQVGVKDWKLILERNLERPEIRAELNDALANLRSLRAAVLQVLEGGDASDVFPPPSRKPN